MPEPTASELMARLDALERQLDEQTRRCQALQEQVEGLLRVPFRVLGREGRVVLEVTDTEAGVRLRLREGDGRFLVTLGSIRSGGSLAIHGAESSEVVGLAAGPHGGTIGVNANAGTLLGWLNVTESGGHLVLRSPEGETTTLLP
jgi:hypothetical protein